MANAVTGLMLAAVAGVANATFTLPMKFARQWAWENIWFVWAVCPGADRAACWRSRYLHPITTVRIPGSRSCPVCGDRPLRCRLGTGTSLVRSFGRYHWYWVGIFHRARHLCRVRKSPAAPATAAIRDVFTSKARRVAGRSALFLPA